MAPEIDMSQFGEAGPVQAVDRWLRLAFDDYASAWDLTTFSFRERAVEAWVTANRDHPWLRAHADTSVLVERMMAGRAAPIIWLAFFKTQMEELQRAWPHRFEGWGASDRPRPVGVDSELVVLVDTQGEARIYTEPTAVPAVIIRVRLVDGVWQVDGYQDSTD